MSERLGQSAMSDTASLNTRSGGDLGTQVWVAQNGRGGLEPDKFRPIEVEDYPWWKPRKGGLWTAQWDEQWGGGWVQWCLGEQFDGPTWKHVWLLEPEPDARLLTIDSYADLERVYERWPHPFPDDYPSRLKHGYPAWERVAEHFDGVHVTEEGQWRTRLTHPLSLYGWDCESTLWFRWAFTDLTYLGERTFPEKPWEADDA